MAVCIPSYMIASSLISSGLSLWEAIACVFLGNIIVLVPMILNGMPGTKYGIPYPVFARASFGVLGSNIPALLRAMVACGWFGIQTWIGGTGILSLMKLFWPGIVSLPQIFPEWMGLETAGFICFLIFWVINVWLIIRGVESIKFLEAASAPLLLISGLALLIWALVAVGQHSSVALLFSQPSRLMTPTDFWKAFIPGLTGMVGYWATLSLNIPDFTRYAKNQKSQMWGQALGLPTTMTLFAFIGVVVTKATEILYGQPMWNPVDVVERFQSPVILFFALFSFLTATLSTNVAANIVGPANDFSNLWPEKISFKTGGLITAVIGILMFPWKLIADPSGYIFKWLIAYSSLLGPIGGILIVDYFFIQKQKLSVDSLYQARGRYWYTRGINWRAVAAFIIGVIPNLPGFLIKIEVSSNIPPFFETLYSYAWFVGMGVSGVLYWLFMRRT